jgi:hypothetical protein
MTTAALDDGQEARESLGLHAFVEAHSRVAVGLEPEPPRKCTPGDVDGIFSNGNPRGFL